MEILKVNTRVIAKEPHTAFWCSVHPGDSLTIMSYDWINDLYKVLKDKATHPVWMKASELIPVKHI